MAKSKTSRKTKSKGKRSQRAAVPAEQPIDRPERKSEAPGGRAAKTTGSKAERQAVVILPMHRSGSSALSRVLSLLGCDLPKTLMGGNETNPTGHWESTEIRALNDDLLASGGSQWQDWQAFNPNWYRTPKPGEFQARALKILQEEFGDSSLFVFKDPRVCRIFPFWRDTFAEAGITPKIILTLRHPQEVAASLERRKDNGLPVLVGLLLWLRYMLEAEADSRGMTRAIVSYDRLLRDPVGVAESLQDQMGLFWPSLSELQADEIRGYVDPTLRHHNAAAEAGFAAIPDFREWLEEVYEIFLRWSRDGEVAGDYPALDAVRTRLNDLAEPLHRVIGKLTAQAGELAAARSARDAAWVEKDQLAQELSQRDGAIDELQGKLHTLKSALEQRSHEAEETAKALKEAQGLIAQQAQELDERTQAVTQLREKASQLDVEATAQAGDLAQMARMIIEKEEALKLRNAAANEASEQASGLQQDVARLQQDMARLQAELEARNQALAEVEAHRQELLGSTSWRVTAPLRRLVSRLKR